MAIDADRHGGRRTHQDHGQHDRQEGGRDVERLGPQAERLADHGQGQRAGGTAPSGSQSARWRAPRRATTEPIRSPLWAPTSMRSLRDITLVIGSHGTDFHGALTFRGRADPAVGRATTLRPHPGASSFPSARRPSGGCSPPTRSTRSATTSGSSRWRCSSTPRRPTRWRPPRCSSRCSSCRRSLAPALTARLDQLSPRLVLPLLYVGGGGHLRGAGLSGHVVLAAARAGAGAGRRRAHAHRPRAHPRPRQRGAAARGAAAGGQRAAQRRLRHLERRGRGAGRPARRLLRRLGGARRRRRVLRRHRRDPRHLRAPARPPTPSASRSWTASAAASATCAGTGSRACSSAGEALALVFFTLIVPIEVVYASETLETGEAGYGVLLSSWGAGVVLGSFVFLGVAAPLDDGPDPRLDAGRSASPTWACRSPRAVAGVRLLRARRPGQRRPVGLGHDGAAGDDARRPAGARHRRCWSPSPRP